MADLQTMPQGAKPTPPWQGLLSFPVWLVGVVVGGAIVRVVRWSDGLSLNSDELFIALNLERRSFFGLHGLLDYDQLAPPGWLWLEKTILILSREEMALRLPSLVAGCAVVALTGLLARRLLLSPLAVAAAVLTAGGPILIYQSSQLKQYSVEAAACVLLLVLALSILDDPQSPRRLVAFWASGAVGVWFATTVIFVTASVGGLLLLFALLERRWELVRRHAVAAVPTIISILAVYVLAPPVPKWLFDWWSRTYPGSMGPRRIGLRSMVRWSGRLVDGFSVSSLGNTFSAVGTLLLVVLVAVGVVALLVRLPRHGAVVVGPLVTGYLLGLLRLYPVTGRVALWLVPIVLVVLCAGVDALVRGAGHLLRRVTRSRFAATAGVAASAAAAVVLVVAFLPELGRPFPWGNARRYAAAEDAVRFIAANRRPGDRVLVYNRDTTTVVASWYGPEAGLRPDAAYTTATGAVCNDVRGAADLAGAPRVWLLRVHWGAPSAALKHPEREVLSRYGRLVEQRWYNAVLVLHYAAPPNEPRPPTASCLVTLPLAG